MSEITITPNASDGAAAAPVVIPAAGASSRVLNGTAIDLYLGIDDNGDGQASQDELRCAAVTGAAFSSAAEMPL